MDERYEMAKIVEIGKVMNKMFKQLTNEQMNIEIAKGNAHTVEIINCCN